MSLFLLLINFFSCVGGSFPQPEIPFLENPNDDKDGDGFTENIGDCDDADPEVNPFAEEVCDEIDNNCNGVVDADSEETPTWYQDNDGDAFGVEALVYTEPSCSRPEGYVSFSGDCDDESEEVNPDAVEICDGLDNDCDQLVDDQDSFWLRETGQIFYGDGDGDGYGWPGFFVESCTAPPNMVLNSEDCDDNNRFISPEATEICDGLDNNCDSKIDDDDELLSELSALSLYLDDDGDGFGDPNVSILLCSVISPYVANKNDCNDASALIHPEALEVCDDVDNNCDTLIDNDPIDVLVYYDDNDGDGFGDISTEVILCPLSEEEEVGTSFVSGDCNDEDVDIFPDNQEVCDEKDNNCDGVIDENLTSTFYRDEDGDGFGTSETVDSCIISSGYSIVSGDCSDSDNQVFPGNEEVCDAKDNNCDGFIDESTATDATDWFLDLDGDGYGQDANILHQCVQPYGYAEFSGDCDDLDPMRFPDTDTDGDGFFACESPTIFNDCDDELTSVFPFGSDLVGDGIDQNCDEMDATIQISVDKNTSCGVVDGIVKCWGDSIAIQKIDNAQWIDIAGDTGCWIDDTQRMSCFGSLESVGVPSVSVSSLGVGTSHYCAILSSNFVNCGGDDLEGRATPPSSKIYQMSVGTYHNCGLDAQRNIQCWGDNSKIQSNPPSGSFVQVTVGNYHSCALDALGTVTCFGDDEFGQSSSPEQNFSFIDAAWNLTCGILETGAVQCWGQTEKITIPTDVQAQSLSVGEEQVCIVDTDNELRCFGDISTPTTQVDEDLDGSTVLNDCDDTDAQLTPFDMDTDGFSTCQGDCDDVNAAIGVIDADGDGYACLLDCDDSKAYLNEDDADGDGYTSCDGDCNDQNSEVSPLDSDGDGYSLCDGDCRDDDDSIRPRDDFDGDGFTYCEDCNDDPNNGGASIYPGSAFLESETACMKDADGDGWGENLTHLCCLEVQLNDSYGNGWDGATLLIEQNGKYIDEITLTAEELSGVRKNICLPEEGDFSVTYQTGSWDGENTYTIVDPDNGTMLSDGPFPTNIRQTLSLQFGDYLDPTCLERSMFDSGKDCDDSNSSLTGEDKDGDGSTLCDGDCDDFDPMVSGEDLDRDGYSECNGDCDDSDPFDMLDRDGDGFSLCTGDCNDYGFWTNPRSLEWVQDGVDQNCDGSDQIITVSAGYEHSCGIGLEGKISCWGEQFSIMETPTESGFVAISASNSATVAIDINGIATCWGNQCDELPNSSFVDISQGADHGCGIVTNGEIRCWGDEDAIGMIPSGTFLQVAAGEKSTCALDISGKITCWGQDIYSEVSEKPIGEYLSIKSNLGQFCVMDQERKINCWGSTGTGMPFDPVLDYSVGYQSGCVIDQSNKLVCWGMVGSIPKGDFLSVSSGITHACGVDSDNFIHCWGNFDNGKTDVDVNLCTSNVDKDGDGYLACEDDCDDTDPNIMPIDLDGDGYSPCTGDCDESNVALNGEDKDGDGSSATCDLDCNDFNSFLNTRDRDNDGWTTCDGDCDDGDPLLNQSDLDVDSWTSCEGDFDDSDMWSYPYAFDPIRDGIDQNSDGQDGSAMLVAAKDYTCGIDAQGAISCFGNNDVYGQISLSPFGEFSHLDAGEEHACAVDFLGDVTCWGDNSNGETDAIADMFYTVAVGLDFSCGLDVLGNISCWGDTSHSVVSYEALGHYLSVSAGDNHVCALDDFGFVECWGQDDFSQIQSPNIQMMKLSSFGNRSCALSRSNEIYCWGDISLTLDQEYFIDLSVGGDKICGVTIEKSLRCWDDVGNDVSPQESSEGLIFSYYQLNEWLQSEELAELTPYKTGSEEILQDNGNPLFESDDEEYFAIVMEGYIYSDGEEFSIYTSVDDHIRLFIDDVQYFDYYYGSGTHDYITIDEGWHDIRIEYYQEGGGTYFEFRMYDNQGNDITSESIFFDTNFSNVHSVSVGNEHYCILYTDNTFNCYDDTDQISNNTSWCLEYADIDGDGFSVCDGDCDDTSIFLTLNDFDGDGFTTCDGDCNDVDETIGITDNDGDGYADCLDDCDANDIWIHPNALDYIGDDIDQDCDGVDKKYQLSGSSGYMCGVNTRNDLNCWEYRSDEYEENGQPIDDIIYVDASAEYPCALKSDSTLHCWNVDYNEPLEDMPSTQIRQYSVSPYGYACSLDMVGALSCWGTYAYLMDDSPIGYFAAVEVGHRHACVLGFDQLVQCWGENDYGQTDVPEGTYQKIQLGSYSTCALDMEGKIHCWGRNVENELEYPDGTYVDIIEGRGYEWEQKYCVIDASGNVDCWGDTACDISASTRIVEVGISSNGICGVDEDGELYCCGDHGYTSEERIDSDKMDGNILLDCLDEVTYSTYTDEDGDGYSICDGDRDDLNASITPEDLDGDGVSSNDGDCDDNDSSILPIDLDGDGFSSNCDGDCDDSNPFAYPHAMDLVGDGIDQDCDGVDAKSMISMFSSYACGINEHQKIQCFNPYDSYIEYNQPEGEFVAISTGEDVTCALSTAGEIECWGWGGLDVQEYVPTGTFVNIHVTSTSACATSTEGEIRCWGWDSHGKNQMPNDDIISVRQGYEFSCGLDNTLQIHCWGGSYYSQIYPPLGRFEKIATADHTACSLEQNGRILCWGHNEYGHLDVPSGSFIDIDISKIFACAIDTNNKVHCWGGYEDDDEHHDIQGDFQDVVVGDSFGCGFTLSNDLKCWNNDGELSVDVDEDGLSLLQDCDDNDSLMNHNDADGDGYSTCDGDYHDNNAELNLDDVDGDGISSLEGDCDDNDPSLIPIDLDGDGFSENCDNDCDDSNPFIHPYGIELIGDGIDQNCDGTDADRMIASSMDVGCSLLPTRELSCYSESSHHNIEDVPEGVFTYVQTGDRYACALDEQGEITCWGNNEGNALENVPSGSFNQIALGAYNGCALDDNGEIECWGTWNSITYNIPNGSFLQLFMHSFGACALDAQRELTCWGDIYVPEGFYSGRSYVKLGLGFSHICTLDIHGVVDCFWNNGEEYEQPIGTFEDIFTGGNQTCVLNAAGFPTCFGPDYCYVEDTPETSFTTLSVKDCSSCGLDENNQVVCWGVNEFLGQEDVDGDGYDKAEDCNDTVGTITPEDNDGDGYSTCDGDWNDQDASLNLDDADGDGFTTLDGDCQDDNALFVPIDFDGDGFSVNCDNDCDDTNILIGPHGVDLIGDGIDQNCDGSDATFHMDGNGFTNCYLQGTDSSHCWGNTWDDNVLPEGSYSYISMGWSNGCSLGTSGELSCFGESSPIINYPTGSFSQVSLSNYTGCALDNEGQITCWGEDNSEIPEGTFVRISNANYYQCGISTEGEILCWGSVNGEAPSGKNRKFVDIDSGDYHTCALDVWGQIICFGENNEGQITAPTGEYTKIYTGSYHSCALDVDGYATCWGSDYSGEVGNTPSNTTFVELLLGAYHTCGETTDGDFECWGDNNYGILFPGFEDGFRD